MNPTFASQQDSGTYLNESLPFLKSSFSRFHLISQQLTNT